MSLTERIRKLAEPANLTFASIEREAGIGRGTIRKWDINCPSADKLLKVANLLNSSLDYLMTGGENNSISLSSYDIELLDLVHQLPRDAQIEFKGEIKGYLKCMNKFKESKEPLKKAK